VGKVGFLGKKLKRDKDNLGKSRAKAYPAVKGWEGHTSRDIDRARGGKGCFSGAGGKRKKGWGERRKVRLSVCHRRVKRAGNNVIRKKDHTGKGGMGILQD